MTVRLMNAHEMDTVRTLFFPKVGATLGYQDEAFNIGPSWALAIETGHFVVSLDVYFSLIQEGYADYNCYAASLTLGYKF